MTVEESMHVVFDEINPKLQDQGSKNADDEDMLWEKLSGTINQSVALPKEWTKPKGLLKDNIICDFNQGVSTRCRITYCVHVAFVSQIEPKNVNEALSDSNWVMAMQDELNQFRRNDVWFLVPIQHSKSKHIEIRHNFFRDHGQKGDCKIKFVIIENQLADLITKPLARDRLNKLRTELGILGIKNVI